MGRKNIERTRYNNAGIQGKLAIKAMVYFQNNGVKGITMSKMARDLSMSKTTIYNHFNSKEELLEAALDYKLGVISEYESVLENITLPYTERYRKAMLFFCVQLFDISTRLMGEIRDHYPDLWKKVLKFQKQTFINLKSYYEIGIDIGAFKSDCNPVLMSLDDQQFFEMLGMNQIIEENDIQVIDAFNHHFKMKFQGIVDPKFGLTERY
ncbi:MAG: TetR/AcrR family transcriptional regulator [Flavobacteriales bacterium]|nr:TetR/AcrR family transcriptional regulator [Flavobacteriales bacterium]